MENTKDPAKQLAENITNAFSDPETEVEIYQDDKLIDIKISGFFAKRLNLLTNTMINQKPVEDILVSYEKMAQDDTKFDQFTFNLETMLTLMRAIEDSARENGALKKVKLNEIQSGLV